MAFTLDLCASHTIAFNPFKLVRAVELNDPIWGFAAITT